MNSISTALTNIRRSPYQSLAALTILTLTFFVAYVFSFAMAGSEVILRYFETQPQVIAFFNVGTDSSQITALTTELEQQSFVKSVKVVSQNEALDLYRQQNQDEPLLLELVTSDILPASIEASGETIEDLSRIKTFLDQNTLIDEVILQQDVIDTLSTWTYRLRLVGISIMAILGILSLMIVITLISMKVVAKRPAITIMRIIGATRNYIQSPFVLEGLIYGGLSAVVGWLMSYLLLIYSSSWIQGFFEAIPIFPIPIEFLSIQVGAGLLIGIFFGALAGSVAVSRIIKR